MNEYKTPRALEQAVKAAAKATSRDTNSAISGFYHDRFLCRIFGADPNPSFILKGGQSMLAKLPDVRETRDIDLLGRTSDLDEALSILKELAAMDLGDYIDYRFVSATPVDISQEYREGYAVTFEVWLGGTKRISAISIDLVVDAFSSDEYEKVLPLHRLKIKGLTETPYYIYTSEKRVAEKVCATMQTYRNRPSSRVKDLVDLVTSMRGESISSDKVAKHITSECKLRQIAPFDTFLVPANWKGLFSERYRTLAREAALPSEFQNAAVAEETIQRWLDPVLRGETRGYVWNPDDQKWIERRTGKQTDDES